MKNLALKNNEETNPMSKTEFVQKLRDIGKERYHDNCKFHHLLHSGKLNKGQVQAWALNRYYYQINISIKDSALMSRIKNPELRRVWIKRILATTFSTSKIDLASSTTNLSSSLFSAIP